MPLSRRQSLAVKIPLTLSLLLLAALTAMSVASYIELRRALTEMATVRLQQAGDQMANVFAMMARQRSAAMRQLMHRDEIRQYLATHDAALEPSIHEAIRGYLGPTAAIAGVEIWDSNGKRILASGATIDEVNASQLDGYKRDLSTVDDVAVGRLRVFADGLRYPVGGAVSSNGQIAGYVVERRRITSAAQSRQIVQLLTGLIGNEASIVIGNADGSTWSDLETPITGIPIRGDDRRLWDYQRAGRERSFAWATPINSTPWAVAIEFPRDVVLGPSQRLIARSLAIALVLLIVTAAVGWSVSRRITNPLVRVTEAAEAVAESRPHVPVKTDREDEIGRLADSFNTMATRVELGRADLELRVELRTAELRAANQELESFSYSVSHDLRAPLRAIAGFVQILDEDYGPTLDPNARKHLERVKVNASRMGQLIDDLLNFSKIGRVAMKPQVVDLTAMAKQAADDAIALAEKKVDVTIETLPPAYGEPSLLKQVFANLLANAVKFSARVDAPAITIGSKVENGRVIYFVRDNGVGFDDRYAEKLFGVFQRLHRATDFEGTGVGLAIVHRVISRHGGRVWAEGKVLGGATFYFTLPPAQQQPS